MKKTLLLSFMAMLISHSYYAQISGSTNLYAEADSGRFESGDENTWGFSSQLASHYKTDLKKRSGLYSLMLKGDATYTGESRFITKNSFTPLPNRRYIIDGYVYVEDKNTSLIPDGTLVTFQFPNEYLLIRSEDIPFYIPNSTNRNKWNYVKSRPIVLANSFSVPVTYTFDVNSLTPANDFTQYGTVYFDDVKIAELSPITIESKVITHVTSYNNSDGKVVIILKGGTAPFHYRKQWDGEIIELKNDSLVIDGLSSGTYTIDVTDDYLPNTFSGIEFEQAKLGNYAHSITFTIENIPAVCSITNHYKDGNNGQFEAGDENTWGFSSILASYQKSNFVTHSGSSSLVVNGDANFTGNSRSVYKNSFTPEIDKRYVIESYIYVEDETKSSIPDNTLIAVQFPNQYLLTRNADVPFFVPNSTNRNNWSFVQSRPLVTDEQITVPVTYTFDVNSLEPNNPGDDFGTVYFDDISIKELCPISLAKKSIIPTTNLSAKDGSILIQLKGGTSPYHYQLQWNGEIKNTTGDSIYIGGLEIGDYTIHITDDYLPTTFSGTAFDQAKRGGYAMTVSFSIESNACFGMNLYTEADSGRFESGDESTWEFSTQLATFNKTNKIKRNGLYSLMLQGNEQYTTDSRFITKISFTPSAYKRYAIDGYIYVEDQNTSMIPDSTLIAIQFPNEHLLIRTKDVPFYTPNSSNRNKWNYVKSRPIVLENSFAVPVTYTFDVNSLNSNNDYSQYGTVYFDDVKIKELCPVTIVEKVVSNPTDFYKQEGKIMIVLSGGTAPYHVRTQWNGKTMELKCDTLFLENLAPGMYTVDLTDDYLPNTFSGAQFEQAKLGQYAHTITFTVEQVTSINSDVIKKEMNNVFPNPLYFSDKITVVSSKEGTLEILNLQGKRIKVVLLEEMQNEVDISSLDSGSYIFTIKNSKGSETNKVIIMR